MFTSNVPRETKWNPQLPQISTQNWASVCCSCDWTQVAVNFVFRLTHIPMTGNELRLILSCGWLGFWLLDTSCAWFHTEADSNCSDWIRVTAGSIQRLTRVPGAGYELRQFLFLIPFYDWLELWRQKTSYVWFNPASDSSSCGWIRVTANYILKTSCSWFYSLADSCSGGWTRFPADLYF